MKQESRWTMWFFCLLAGFAALAVAGEAVQGAEPSKSMRWNCGKSSTLTVKVDDRAAAEVTQGFPYRKKFDKAVRSVKLTCKRGRSVKSPKNPIKCPARGYLVEVQWIEVADTGVVRATCVGRKPPPPAPAPSPAPNEPAPAAENDSATTGALDALGPATGADNG